MPAAVEGQPGTASSAVDDAGLHVPGFQASRAFQGMHAALLSKSEANRKALVEKVRAFGPEY